MPTQWEPPRCRLPTDPSSKRCMACPDGGPLPLTHPPPAAAHIRGKFGRSRLDRRLFSGRWCGSVGGARGRRRVHGGALLLGPLKFRWTTCVRLDHLSSVGSPGSRNTVVQRHLSGPSRSAASRHAKRCPTMRDGRWGGASAGRRNRPAARTVRLPGPDDPSKPDRPRRPTRRSRRAPHPPTHPEETRAGHQG